MHTGPSFAKTTEQKTLSQSQKLKIKEDSKIAMKSSMLVNCKDKLLSTSLPPTQPQATCLIHGSGKKNTQNKFLIQKPSQHLQKLVKRRIKMQEMGQHWLVNINNIKQQNVQVPISKILAPFHSQVHSQYTFQTLEFQFRLADYYSTKMMFPPPPMFGLVIVLYSKQNLKELSVKRLRRISLYSNTSYLQVTLPSSKSKSIKGALSGRLYSSKQL